MKATLIKNNKIVDFTEENVAKEVFEMSFCGNISEVELFVSKTVSNTFHVTFNDVSGSKIFTEINNNLKIGKTIFKNENETALGLASEIMIKAKAICELI